MSNVSVTNVATETTGHGFEVTVTIRRDWRVYAGAVPDPADVPEDIRQGLRRWLASGWPRSTSDPLPTSKVTGVSPLTSTDDGLRVDLSVTIRGEGGDGIRVLDVLPAIRAAVNTWADERTGSGEQVLDD